MSASAEGAPAVGQTLTTEQREKLLDAITDADQALRDARSKYLRKTGWEYTCETPGSYWLWEKKLPDGRTIVASAEHAVRIEGNL